MTSSRSSAATDVALAAPPLASDEARASTATPLGYLPSLDGVRAVAVLLVILVHAFPRQFPGGHVGVDVFFALSGFLITKLLMEEFDRKGTISFRKFYLRRALRLLPALLLLLIVHQGILAAQARADGTAYPKPGHLMDLAQVLFYFANWTRAFDFYPSSTLAHCWSLSIEEQYYLIWPVASLFVLSRLKDRPALRVGLCAALGLAFTLWRIALVPHATPERIYNGLDTRADILVLGSTAGVLYHHYGDRIALLIAANRSLVRVLGLLLVLGMLFALRNAEWYEPDFGRWYLTAFALLLPPALVVLACHRTGPLHRLLSTGPMVRIGKISYGIYLWHFPVFMFYLPLIGFGQEWRLPLGLPVTLLCAWASYRFLEQPLLARKRRYVV